MENNNNTVASTSASRSMAPGVVKKLLTQHNKMRITPDANEIVCELLRCFVRDLHQRASIEAECDAEAMLPSSGKSNINSNNNKTN